MYKGQTLSFKDFSGGLVTTLPATSLGLHQAADLDNIIILPGGLGITNCRGNTAFNTAAMNGGAAVTGLAYFQTLARDNWLVAISGDKIFKSDNLDGTMDDITGAVTITNNADNIWSFVPFNDKIIAFGFDAPWQWNGSGDATALGGSPPTADFGFAHNNRVFALQSSTDTIRWCVLGDPEDWSGVGSGFAAVGSLEDSQTLIGAAALTNDQALLFKENSVYQMSTRNLVDGAFPIFPLHSGVGACGKHAIVNVRDEVFFITPQGSMLSTNGQRVQSYPPLINDLWDSLYDFKKRNIHGIHYEGQDHDWLIWIVSTGVSSTHNLALIWDLNHNCWLKRTQGLNANVAAVDMNGNLYTGGYNGYIYIQDVESKYTMDSENDAAVSWKWRTGWITGDLLKKIRPQSFAVQHTTSTIGELNFSVGFNFNEDAYTKQLPMEGGTAQWDVAKWDEDKWGSNLQTIRGTRLTGMGNSFQFAISGSDAIIYTISQIDVNGKMNIAQKLQQGTE